MDATGDLKPSLGPDLPPTAQPSFSASVARSAFPCLEASMRSLTLLTVCVLPARLLSEPPSLTVSPAAALIDEVVKIQATGLKPGQEATVHLRSYPAQGSRIRCARVVFAADAEGKIDLGSQAPLRGAYANVDPMGLFWYQAAGPWEGPKDRRGDVIDLEVDGKLVASATLRRGACFGSQTDEFKVAEGGVVGTLWSPKGARALPALLVLGGSEGGQPNWIAAYLASKGFTALALAYFKAPGLPKTLEKIPLETLLRGADWLARRPEADPARIGVFGGSKGAEAALVLAASFPNRFQAVVANKASSRVWPGVPTGFFSALLGMESSWTLDGKPLPCVPLPLKSPYKDGRMFPAPLYQAGLKEAAPDTRIPVERIQAPVLVTGGGKDGLWPSAEMAEEVARHRRACPYGKGDEVLIYPDAGHGLEPPYGSVIDDGPFINGGDPAANAQARADAWPRIVTFLRRHLASAPTPPSPGRSGDSADAHP